MLLHTKNKINAEQEPSDIELIQGVQRKERIALNRLMKRYEARLYAFIVKYINDENEAYDILQETFTKVYFKAESFNPEYHVSTWIYSIATNLCRDYKRKNRLASFLLMKPASTENMRIIEEAIPDNSPSPESISETRNMLGLLKKEIDKLPHNLKSALILFSIEENSQEECAKLLGVSVKTIETRVYRARKILAKKLGLNS